MANPNLTKTQKEEIKKEVDKQIKKDQLSKAQYLRLQFKQHTSTAVIAAFSFLMALAWRDLISTLINNQVEILGINGNNHLSLLITAIIITIFSVIGIILVSKWAGRQ